MVLMRVLKTFFLTIVVLFLIISSAPQNVYDVYATMLGTFSHVFFLFSMTLCNITPLHYNSSMYSQEKRTVHTLV